MKNLYKYLILLILTGASLYLCFAVERDHFIEVLGFYSLAFVAYALILKYLHLWTKRDLIITALAIKVVLIFSIPNLSEDYARFIWDGRESVEGRNPYLSLPSEDIEKIDSNQNTSALYQELNSKSYFTIYPPANQAIFAISTWISGNDTRLNIIWLKIFIFLSEVGIILLLPIVLNRLKLNTNLSFIYILNPLVNIETVGNVHFEGMMFFFMLLALWLWLKNKRILSPLAFALAVGTKLIPLMFFPLLVNKIGWKKTFIFGIITTLGLAAMFTPFISEELISNFWSSLDLYFQNFEFNASLFYLVRGIGFLIIGYDIIQDAGPIMILIAGLSIMVLGLQKIILKKEFFEKVLIALTIYLLFTTTIHPWYIITLIGISVFSKFRYPILWSFLIVISYSHYDAGNFEENYPLIALEYVILFIGIAIEYFRITKQKISLP